MKKHFIMTVFLAANLCLTGCWDKVELENRGFVVSLGIDKCEEKNEPDGDSRYTISLALPNVEAMASPGGNEESKSVKKADHMTVAAAMGLLDSYSSEKLYYGQTRVAVLGKDVLEDDVLFREAVDALERNPEISRKLIMLGTDSAALDILEAKAPGEPFMGLFVSNYYQNRSRPSATFRLDLEDMTEQLRRGAGVIPKIQIENEEIRLEGAAVMKDYKLAGWLNREQTRGYLWAKGNGVGAQLPACFEGTYLTLRVDRNKAKARFYEDGEQSLCVLTIQVEGVIDELSKNEKTENLHALRRLYEDMIQSEVLEVCRAFQNEFQVDGFGLGNQSGSSGLFTVEPRVEVTIHGTGSVM